VQKTQSSRIMEIPDKLVKIKDELRSEKHAGSICVANYKGGVGKTTMSCLLGYYLAKKGKKVLLIDIDPQCSLSLAVGFDLGKVSKTDSTIYDLVSPSKWAKIKKVKFNNYVDSIPDIYAPSTLKIIKGSFDVDNLDIAVIQAITDDDRNKSELFFYCLNMLNASDDFDYVIVDCPPNKMFLTQAMLRACSYYMTVTIPDKISVFGMPRLLRWVKKIPEDVKPKLLGCVLNAVNRAGGFETGTKNQQAAIQELLEGIEKDLDAEEKRVLGSNPLLAYIPRLDVISKFLSQGDEKIARFDFNRKTSGQRDVNSVMMNFVNRIEKRISDYA